MNRISRSSSTLSTRTCPWASYISHSQTSSAPSTIRPLLLEYQNLVVILGSASASNTSCGFRRISIATCTVGGLVSLVDMNGFLSSPVVSASQIITGHLDKNNRETAEGWTGDAP